MTEIVETKVTVRMPEDLHRRLKVVAVNERKSVQEIVNGLVAAWVARKEAEASE